MNALIFGSSGQDGFYLKNLLVKCKLNVTCVSRSSGDILGDISNKKFVHDIISKTKPDYIFHLAALSNVNHKYIYENFNSISLGTLNILESIVLEKLDSRVFICGSAYQFKITGNSIDENTEFNPSNPYSISRINSVYLARYYREKFDLKIYIGYLFHHDSPLRSNKFINIKIINHARNISLKKCNNKLSINDINFIKEFNYAKEIVEAMWILVNQDKIFEVVIGSGIGYSIKDWIVICYEHYELSWKDHVIVNNLQVKSKKIISSPKLINSLGWKHNTSIHKLAEILS